MKGDFARVTFDPARHYSQVFQQQGRVLLEADWNEQAAIQLDLLRALARDLVGSCWAADTGFSITTQPHPADWQLSAGHFYVDGILCVNEDACTLATQPYAPLPDPDVLDDPPAEFALYLDVWERHLSALEAPGLNDIALDGIETASRAQVIWQVCLLDTDAAHVGVSLDDTRAAVNLRLQSASTDADKAMLKQQLADLDKLRDSLGGQTAGKDPCVSLGLVFGARATYAWPRLRAQLGPVEADNDPCVIAADARYRGCENQLYRIEVHQGGLAGTAGAAGGASFKWSRENGSVLFPVVSAASTQNADGSAQLAVTLGHLGRDQRLGLAVNDWVELVDDSYTLAQRALPLLQVSAIDAGDRIVTLSVPKSLTPYLPASDAHPLLRRWDQRNGLTTQGTVPLIEGEAIDLEDGIQVVFEPGGQYATGDYWQIPARVGGNGMLDWPQVAGVPAAMKARGMHHRAVLGVLGADGAYHECCCRFGSLCDMLKGNALPRPARPLRTHRKKTPNGGHP
jgi:hypothetical protein